MMNADEEINEFLAKPENLPLVLDVARRVDDVRRLLIRRFWDRVEEMLHEWTATTRDIWIVEKCIMNNDPLSNYCYCLLKQEVAQGAFSVQFSVQQENPNLKTYIGLSWSRERAAIEPQSELLRSILQELKLRNTEFTSWWHWWPAIRPTGIFLNSDSGLHELASGDELARQHADMLLELFQNFRESVEAVNQEIAQHPERFPAP